MKKQHKEKTKKVIRYWRSGNIYPADITDSLDKIIDNALSNESNEVHPIKQPLALIIKSEF